VTGEQRVLSIPREPVTSVAPRDVALLIGITLIWGLNLVLSKVGVSEFPPVLFTSLRFLLLGLPLIALLRIHRGQMGALGVACVLIGALPFALNFIGLRYLDSVSSAAIASQLSVPFTTLLSIALLGEVVRWRRWTGILLAFAGVLVMGFDPQFSGRWHGLAFVIASAFVNSLGVISVKKLNGIRPLELQAWCGWISAPLLGLVSGLIEHPTLHTVQAASLGAWGSLAFTAFAASLVAHTGYFHLVQRYPVTSVAPLTTLSPVFSVAFGVLLLGDQLSPRIIAGGVCTLAGVLIITIRERRIVDTGS
jgi:O-acetylserine/cysteine efflux transporter